MPGLHFVLFSLASFFLCFPAACGDYDRPAAVSGQFYPGEKAQLRETVDRLLSGAKKHELTGRVAAFLVPHAGYVYSGATAARTYKSMGTKWKTVVLLGPSHRKAVKVAAIWPRGSFQTPLGPVPVDESLASALMSGGLFEDSREAHATEHSLEVQLPFLQAVLKDFKIVPVVLNTEDPDLLRRMGEQLAQTLKGRRDTLLLLSSDLSHYPSSSTARAADRTFLRALERMDPDYLQLTEGMLLSRNEPELATLACGGSALLVGLRAARLLGADRVELLEYVNSGELPQGEPGRAVGYAAAALIASGRPAPARFDLGAAAKKNLLSQARRSIRESFEGGELKALPLSTDPSLNLPAAVFVTLKREGLLRGCIGMTEPRMPLQDAVRYFARAAAFEDRRFQPVAKDELEKVHLEISILTQPVRVKDHGAVVPGKHGVTARQGRNSGLFLPTVWEQLPTKEEFLTRLCAESRASPDCWKDSSVILSVFESKSSKNERTGIATNAVRFARDPQGYGKTSDERLRKGGA